MLLAALGLRKEGCFSLSSVCQVVFCDTKWDGGAWRVEKHHKVTGSAAKRQWCHFLSVTTTVNNNWGHLKVCPSHWSICCVCREEAVTTATRSVCHVIRLFFFLLCHDRKLSVLVLLMLGGHVYTVSYSRVPVSPVIQCVCFRTGNSDISTAVRTFLHYKEFLNLLFVGLEQFDQTRVRTAWCGWGGGVLTELWECVCARYVIETGISHIAWQRVDSVQLCMTSCNHKQSVWPEPEVKLNNEC